MTDFLFGDTGADPLNPNLPSAQNALLTKYQNPQLQSILGSVPSNVAQSMYQYDLQRAMQGQSPLGQADTQRALYSAATNTEATPSPTHKGHGLLGSLGALVGNVGSDLRDITTSIPRLPFALAHEVTSLPQAPEAISQALSQGDLEGVTRVPGVRLIPGAYTLGNILGGDYGQIVEHPVMTALDVMPAAKELAPTLAQTALGNKAIDLAERAKAAAARTTPGLYASMAFGKESRALSSELASANRGLTTAVQGVTLTPEEHAAFGSQLTDLQKQAYDFSKQFDSIPADRRVELTNMATADPRSLTSATLSDDERAFVDGARNLTDTFGRFNTNAGLLNEMDGEFYTPQQASKMMTLRATRDAAQATNEVRQMVQNPVTDPAEVTSAAQQVIGNNGLSKRTQATLLRGYAHALDAAGYDSTQLLDSVRSVERTAGADWSDVANHFQTPFTPRPILSQNDLIDSLAGPARTDPTIARLADNVAQGNWQQARNLAKTLSRRGTYTVDTVDDMLDSISRYKDQQAWLDKTSNFSDAQVSKLSNKYDQALAATAPARFEPYINNQVGKVLLDRYSSNPNFDAVARAVQIGYYRGVPGLADEADQLSKEIAGTWQDLKANGIDPIFIHKVTPTAAAGLDYPKITDRLLTPSQVKERTGDLSPYIHDFSVAIPHQGLELLQRRATENFVQTVKDHWGAASLGDLVDQYYPAAADAVARNPQLDMAGAIERLARREYDVFDPEAMRTIKAARLSNATEDQIILPKAIARNMELMFHPPANRLTAVLDPIMKLWRTSILPLAPRWHFNNILGNNLLLLSEAGPGAEKYLSTARQMLKDPEAMAQLRDVAVGAGMGSVPKEFVEWDKTTNALIPRGLDLMDEYHFRAGQTLRRIYDSVQPKVSGLIQKSYDFNAVMDDMHRVAGYLWAKDKALTQGLSEAEAHQAGVSLARKVFMQWDDMTPIERMTMRSVFPFYGWSQHVIRYVTQYPWDHPTRAAIMGAFARNELNDQAAGLGSKFLSSFFLGHPDATGNIKTINLNGLNPFRDVANYMTLAGFAGAANPVAQIVMQRMGIDPATGSADLYPTLTYDQNTGRLAAQHPGILSNVVSSFVPQADVVMGMLGANTQFKQLARTNPDAATNLLRSELGLPVITKNVNLYQEQFKSETARHQAQQTALTGALKSGDYGAAEDWPQLVPYLHQIQTLQAGGQLQNYTPSQPTPADLDLLNQAVVLKNT